MKLKKIDCSLALLVFVLLFFYLNIGLSAKSSSLSGYLSSIYVEFPKNKYTFIAVREKEDGDYLIKDNLWGFRYPSMTPLVQETRGEFMKAYRDTDWVKVSVRERKNHSACYTYMVERYQNPDHKPLDFQIREGRDKLLWDKLGAQHNATAVMVRQPGQYYGGLNKISVPDLDVYREGAIYVGPANIYWAEENGAPCVAIRCTYYPKRHPGEYCEHLYFDRERSLQFSMSYDSKLLPFWVDIQRKTVETFESFIGK